jgi:hypothetical protein
MRISQHTGFLPTTLVVALLWSKPAMGEDVFGKLDYGHVSGVAAVHRNQVKWDLRIRDPKPNNRGAYAYVELDRDSGRLDERIFYSRITAGGRTTTFIGSGRGDSHTRGARVFLCEAKRKLPQGSDQCREVSYIPER